MSVLIFSRITGTLSYHLAKKTVWELHKDVACRATYLLSHKPLKSDKPDMLGTAGGVMKNL